MQAEIITIGDEILIGQTLDTNSTFIAGKLSASGITVKQKRTIPDEREAIYDALDSIHPKTKLVFLTGGLGPTNDDITKTALNDYFGGKLVFHQDAFENISRIFRLFNREVSEPNRQQAFLPDCCKVIVNKVGTASGMHFEKDGVHYFSTPGVPYETEYLIEEKILPWINEQLQKGKVVHRTVLTHGIPESELAERIKDWENGLPETLKLAYLPSPGMVKLRLSSYDGDPEEANALINNEVGKLKDILGDVLFGEGMQTLEEAIGMMLKQKKATLSTAESCTGGYIAHLITSVAGSSEYYNGSVVSYSNEAKAEILGVNAGDIEKHGAVSEEVVTQMAEGARKKFHTDFAIATSGVAGPQGDEEISVGTVWIAVAAPHGTVARVYQFGNHRGRNIRRSAVMAFAMLRKEIRKIEI